MTNQNKTREFGEACESALADDKRSMYEQYIATNPDARKLITAADAVKEEQVREALDNLISLVKEDSGVSQRLAEFIWAAHCSSGEINFSLFGSLDPENKARVETIFKYRLYPARGGYELPLSADEKDYLYNRAVQ